MLYENCSRERQETEKKYDYHRSGKTKSYTLTSQVDQGQWISD